MPIPSFPMHLFSRIFASDGAYRVIPDTDAGSGRASQSLGFPPETQRPLSEGGVAPNRTDFNGMFNMLSAFAFWQQSGGMAPYTATLNYAPPALVWHNNAMWLCLAENGPESATGAVTPGTNAAVWVNLKDYFDTGDRTPVGTVISYYGSNAPAGYFACNGGSFSATAYPQLYAVLGSGLLPDFRGYFVRGYDTRNTVDPQGAGRAIGSKQSYAQQRITGRFVTDCDYGLLTEGAFYLNPNIRPPHVNYGGSGKDSEVFIFFDSAREVATASEDRPANVCLLYCIKHD